MSQTNPLQRIFKHIVELDIEELNDHSYHRKKSTWQLLKSFLKL